MQSRGVAILDGEAGCRSKPPQRRLLPACRATRPPCPRSLVWLREALGGISRTGDGTITGSGTTGRNVDGNLLLILIFAGLAAFVFFRLFSVLGQKTGNEQPPPPMVSDRSDSNAAEDKVVSLPRREDAADAVPAWGNDGPVGAGLTQIHSWPVPAPPSR